jgi:hypothetical protein
MKRVNANRRRPRKVLLFSGHMIDAYDREVPRFPPSAEGVAAAAIDAALEDWAVGAEDLGITEGACGGDLLFAEALLARGASLELRLPFRESKFIKESVGYRKKTPPPDRWVERFHAIADHPCVTVHAMPDERGPLPRSDDPYKRCNLWMLRDALAFGAERVRFLCLWNGARGDGPGGTAHMRQSVRRSGGKTVWLDTRKLWET